MRTLLACLFPVLLLTLGAADLRADDASDLRSKALEGHYASAIESGKAAVEANPDDIRSARLVQDLLLLLSQDEKAVAFAEGVASANTSRYLKLRQAEPKAAMNGLKKRKGEDNPPETTQLDFAWALLRYGKASSAETEAKAYVKDHPEDAEGHYLLGSVAMARGKEKNARPALEQALALVPGHPQAAVLLADVLHALEEPAEARRVLTNALSHYSTNPLLRIGLGDDQAKAGDLLAAESTLATLAKEGTGLAAAHSHLAHVLRLEGRYDEAAAEAKLALAIDAKDVIGLETTGFVLFKKKDLDAAMEKYAEVIGVDAQRVEPYVIIGFCHAMKRRLDDAKEMLEKALDLDKTNVSANLKMGVIAFGRGKHRDAKKHFELVLKSNPDNVVALRHMGYVTLSDGKAKEALKHLQRAMQLSEEEDAKTVRMVGRAYFDLGKKEEALAMFEKAVDLAEKDPWANFDLGKARDDAGEYDQAKQLYGIAIELDKTFCWPHLYLAEIYDDIDGDPESALEHYQRYLELGGPDDDKTVTKRIEQLSDE
jgi:tetratricopeptide (TPR) repeat protein